ncbi:hypothetical protein TNCV_1968311 [Trichonephila clavipes]|nr:hypothetical protein TNCV_1968311 [Trichonephila clavipes]
MFDPSSFVDPTPLAHAETSRDVLPRGGTSQGLLKDAMTQQEKRKGMTVRLVFDVDWVIGGWTGTCYCRTIGNEYGLSDDAHFWLNGYVNKQNCRIWSEANPQVYVETPLHPDKLTAWCALWAGGILLQKR